MKTQILLSFVFAGQLLLSCGSDDGGKSGKAEDLKYEDKKLSGNVNGGEVEFIDGYGVEEDGKLVLTLLSETLKNPCTYLTATKPKIYFSSNPKEQETVLSSDLNAEKTATVVTYEDPKVPHNYIITTGKISIDKLTSESIVGKMVLIYPGKIELNGTFNVKRCAKISFGL